MKKKMLTLAAAVLLGTSVCVAQGQRDGNRGPRGNNMEKMKTELGLTDEQAAQLTEVYKQARPAQDGQRPSREEMQKKREEMEAKVKGILTEEQYSKYQKMQQERRQRGPKKDGEKK